MLTATSVRSSPLLLRQPAAQSARQSGRARLRTVTPQSALVLVPKGDGSCAHLDKEVAMPGRITLADGLYELGREAPADIVVPIPTVSSRHAMIRVEGSRVNVTDLNSTNGTYLGNTELTPMKAQDISPGSEITFGDMFLAKFELQDDSSSSSSSS